MPTYRVKDWAQHFEKNRTKEVKYMTWVPFPNKHDGDGYTELVDHPEGAAHYGAWCAIVQVASKCDPRGTLLRDGRRPHTAASLSRITRISEGVLSSAIERLLAIGWLEVTDDYESTYHASQEGATTSQGAAASRARANTERNGTEEEKSNTVEEDTEGQDTEGQDTEEASADAASVRAVFEHYRAYHPRAFPKPLSSSKEWKAIRARLAEGYSVDDLKAAIDGNHNSPFHSGENKAGAKFNALDLIVRDGTHVNDFIEAGQDSNAVHSEKSRRTQRAKEDYLQQRLGTNEQSGPAEIS